MSLIAKFLKFAPEESRLEIIRILNLIQTVEQRENKINDYLKNMRDEYLKELKDKNEDNEEKLYIDKAYNEELSNLSDYIRKLKEELYYIINNKVLPIINKKIEESEKNFQVEPNKNRKSEEKFLNKKTKRNNKKAINKDDFKTLKVILPNNEEDDNTTYCICKNKEKGNMIMCDKCQNWYHFKCIELDENSNPNEFFCKACTEANKENNINNCNYNKKTKKENNMKKKYK